MHLRIRAHRVDDVRHRRLVRRRAPHPGRNSGVAVHSQRDANEAWLPAAHQPGDHRLQRLVRCGHRERVVVAAQVDVIDVDPASHPLRSTGVSVGDIDLAAARVEPPRRIRAARVVVRRGGVWAAAVRVGVGRGVRGGAAVDDRNGAVLGRGRRIGAPAVLSGGARASVRSGIVRVVARRAGERRDARAGEEREHP